MAYVTFTVQEEALQRRKWINGPQLIIVVATNYELPLGIKCETLKIQPLH